MGLLAGSSALAAEPDNGDAAGPDSPYETIVETAGPVDSGAPQSRASSKVDRDEMLQRQPRSAPDALRFEPGVFVQQTAHSQGSVFLRGLTGQQIVLMFDGIRLNNSTYRQGPSQYFFTVDSQSIQSIEVLRGGASTRYGSDALGGALLATPIEPQLRIETSASDYSAAPRLRLKGRSADGELGGRVDASLAVGQTLAFYGGAGGRRVGRLESGGPVRSPYNGETPQVPRFEADGRTQLGTGFNEITADGRLVYAPSDNQRFKMAAYAYRLYDGPRTDQCPAAYAPAGECLNYDEQFRTLVYGVWEAEGGAWGWQSMRATLSWQGQRERRTLRRPSSGVRNTGRDTVDTWGLTLGGKTGGLHPTPWLRLRFNYGLDAYRDTVRSAAWIAFSDIGVTRELSRGQYLDGSHYLQGGAYTEVAARVFEDFRLRAGGRVSHIDAQAPGDAASGSADVDRQWTPMVGYGGIEYVAAPWLKFFANLDHSFRAPNLDDMTSRQQTGAGFQFENPSLAPERSTTYELGGRILGPIRAELWVFRTTLPDVVIKEGRNDDACPPDTPGCAASWTRVQLENADGEIYGAEASLAAKMTSAVDLRGTLSWTRGEQRAGQTDAAGVSSSTPLSRIPPLNGTAEAIWRPTDLLSLRAGLRWAAKQDRLANSDISDERIPAGGTPGFAVLDATASYRVNSWASVTLVAGNIFDAAYRYHGSSVNGPGRGITALLDIEAR